MSAWRGPPWAQWAYPAAALGLLLLIALHVLGPYSTYASVLDITSHDDNDYIYNGLHRSLSNLPAEWAPLYLIWLKFLGKIASTPIDVYFLNAYVLGVALPALIFLAILSCGGGLSMALLGALAWLLSQANLEAYPRVATFAVAILTATIAIARFGRSFPARWCVLTLGMLAAAYVRPELYYAAALLLVWGIWGLIREAPSDRRAWIIALGIVLATAAIAIAAFGVPMGGARLELAFYQHVARNLLVRDGVSSGGDVQMVQHLPATMRQLAAHGSIFDFVRHEPRMMLHHVAANLKLFLPNLATDLRPPAPMSAAAGMLPLAPLVLLGFAAFVQRLAAGRAGEPAAAPPLRHEAFVMLACAALIVLPVCFVIYPRPHYLTSLSMMILFAVATPRGIATQWRSAVSIAAVLAVAAALLQPSYAQSSQGLPHDRVDLIRALNAHPEWKDLRLLDPYAVLAFYVPGVTESLDTTSLTAPFDRYLSDHGINAIAWTPILRDHPVLAQDPSWQRFSASPASLGFTCRPVARDAVQLCIADRLLEKP
ncbi:MAG TPA: hypothetical protein VFB36_10140 [Nevskiaceae bacterium]|nr:hypothetical protein [Nevskiaceae bacterium]